MHLVAPNSFGAAVDYQRWMKQDRSTSMRDQMEQRLQELKHEYEAGQKMLADLEQKKMNLEQTMLRISGAIQVLEEMLAADPSAGGQVPAGEARAAVPNGQV
jgi:hypothetical protein